MIFSGPYLTLLAQALGVFERFCNIQLIGGTGPFAELCRILTVDTRTESNTMDSNGEDEDKEIEEDKALAKPQAHVSPPTKEEPDSLPACDVRLEHTS